MLPLIADPSKLTVALAGSGELLSRRYRLLQSAGIEAPRTWVSGDTPEGLEGVAAESGLPGSDDLKTTSILFIAGLDREVAAGLVKEARSLGTLVNTEDVRELCDFHVPASIRRGELLMTVSTGGGSPGLARRLRKKLESDFGEEWSGRVEELTTARKAWRDQGMDIKDLARQSDDYIDRKGWLK